MSLIPYVIETTSKGERSYDLYSRLLKDRIIMLTGDVEDQISASLVAQMLFLDSEDQKAPIHFYINSPGGVVTSGLSIYDTMQLISAPVHTYVLGQAASMGSFLLSGGEPGHRYALRSARIMIHQVLGGARGQATDMEIQLRETLRLKEFLTRELAINCKQDYEKVLSDCERDLWMTAEQALAYGLIDQIKVK